jgi:hypothetical protein
VVEDDETAFTVFETLNSRRVALGTADLLKNFVFSTAAKGGQDDLEQARIWWDQIVRFRLTQAISQQDWSPSSIRARQQEMAERAVTIWRIEDGEG